MYSDISNEAVISKDEKMYKDAFELIGKLMQNDQVIKEILITKKGFRVRFVNEKHLFNYKFTQIGVESFLDLYEVMENEIKK